MLIEIIFGIAVLVTLLFPVLYAFYFKLNRKLLFLASCYGLEQIISVLLFGLLSPIIILDIFAVPQLDSNQSLENVRWFIYGLHFVESYWYAGMLFILLTSPFIVHRRFKDLFV
jgi:hypothetical protein